MNETEITVILPTSAAKELFFDGWLHGFEPSTWLKDRILKKLSNEPSTPRSARRAANRAAHAAGQAAAATAAPERKAAPTTGLLELFGDGGESEPQQQG